MKTKFTKYRIRVGLRDIKNGSQGESRSCPIALALGRKFKTSDVRVAGYGYGDICINDNNEYRATPAAGNFINRFDSYDSKAVKPFRFTLTKF